MNKIYKVAIIGGGASGLLALTELFLGKNAISPKDVILFEKNDRLGKKLSATGNGQGNILNKNFSQEFYHGDKNFIATFCEMAKGLNLEDYFYRLGIPVAFDSEGRGYPMSRQASSFTDAIRFRLMNKDVTIKLSTKVVSIKKVNDLFEISCENCKVMAKSVIYACGGKASKQFGTDGESYSLLTNFGHTLTKLYPSLVQLKTETKDIKGLKNLRESVKVKAIINGVEVKAVLGDVIFTDFGVSGSAVFKISPYVVGDKNAKIRLEFLPELSLKETEKLIEDKIKYYPIEDENEILSGIINKKIGQAVIKTARSKSAKDIAFALKNFNLKVVGSLGFDYAQVTKGGINVLEVNENTFESKFVKGLYLTGEVLDIDGDCGGYNLTFAFTSGISAAKDIKNKFSHL